MTVSAGRGSGRGPRWRRLRVSHLSWLLGGYFLGSVFLSIARQLFGAPPAAPAPQAPPRPYHRAWCGAQLAGLRVELEIQARGALAGAAFGRAGPALGRAWYPRWLAWHRRASDSCQLPQLAATAGGLEQLAALGRALDEACRDIAAHQAPQRQALDQRLEDLLPRPTLGAGG